MVESRTRKVAFLREAVRATELQEVEVINSRIEDLAARARAGSVGLVTIRAVRLTPKVVSAVCDLVKPGGNLILFGCPDRAALKDGFSDEACGSEIGLLTRRN